MCRCVLIYSTLFRHFCHDRAVAGEYMYIILAYDRNILTYNAISFILKENQFEQNFFGLPSNCNSLNSFPLNPIKYRNWRLLQLSCVSLKKRPNRNRNIFMQILPFTLVTGQIYIFIFRSVESNYVHIYLSLEYKNMNETFSLNAQTKKQKPSSQLFHMEI